MRIVTKYDPDIGWYQVIEEWVNIKLVSRPTKIEDLEWYT